MNSNLNSILKWTLVTIEDPEFLPGKSIVGIIKLIVEVITIKFVILDYINGAADNGLILALQQKKR